MPATRLTPSPPRSGRLAIALGLTLSLATLAGAKDPPQTEATNDADLLARMHLIEARLKEIETSPAAKTPPTMERSPARLPEPGETLLIAEEFVKTKRYREAYLLVKQLRGLPREKLDEETNASACLIAAQLSGINYRMARFSEPKSIWVLTEPEATFQWVCSLQNLDNEKWRTLLTTLLRNTPTQFWRRFEAFQKAHFPEIFPWQIEVELDNGMVVDVLFIE